MGSHDYVLPKVVLSLSEEVKTQLIGYYPKTGSRPMKDGIWWGQGRCKVGKHRTSRWIEPPRCIRHSDFWVAKNDGLIEPNYK